jgi:hypothetical protein
MADGSGRGLAALESKRERERNQGISSGRSGEKPVEKASGIGSFGDGSGEGG